MLVALDTETTGADVWHGCLPFLVSCLIYNESTGDSEFRVWEWPVDPHSRKPIPSETESLKRLLASPKNRYVLHNAKFDVRMLAALGLISDEAGFLRRVDDTLIAAHVLNSLEPHDLKYLSMRYLSIPADDESALQEAVNASRRIGRRLGWNLMRDYHPNVPAVKHSRTESPAWKSDSWLPAAVCLHFNPNRSSRHPTYPCPEEPELRHPWWGVCREYALRDVERTLNLWLVQRNALREEELERVYEVRLQLLRETYQMEDVGLTVSPARAEELRNMFRKERQRAVRVMVSLSGDPEFNPRSNQQIKSLVFGRWKTPVIRRSERTGEPSLGENELEAVLSRLNPQTRVARFLQALQDSRKASKMQEYLDSYMRGIVVERTQTLSSQKQLMERLQEISELTPRIVEDDGTWNPLPDHLLKNRFRSVIHPGLNVTGTRTPRLSSSNPNAQNVASKGRYNLRYMFGPAPGRIWYDLDYSNIELRIFAWDCRDENLIDAFNRGNSVHLIFMRSVYPELAGLSDSELKNDHEETYKRVKNGDFALIYGAGEANADAAYGRTGAYRLIRERLPLVASHLETMAEFAERNGYVWTFGTEETGRYRLHVPTEESYKAVNYRTQGTAAWIMCHAMNEIGEYLREHLPESWQARMILQVHDSLVFDFPSGSPAQMRRNRDHILTIRRIMEDTGKRVLGWETPVEAKACPEHWGQKGVEI